MKKSSVLIAGVVLSNINRLMLIVYSINSILSFPSPQGGGELGTVLWIFFGLPALILIIIFITIFLAITILSISLSFWLLKAIKSMWITLVIDIILALVLSIYFFELLQSHNRDILAIVFLIGEGVSVYTENSWML